MNTIGIVGGGQLGRMLTLAAKPLGFEVVVIDPNENSPARQVGARQIVASLRDAEAIRGLGDQADVITIESEHVDADTLEELEHAGKHVYPGTATIRMVQDKLKQKQFLASNDIPVAPFAEIKDDAALLLEQYGGKMVLKSRFDSFDGRGNWMIDSEASLNEALHSLSDKQLYAEQFMPFAKELAVIGARSTDGEVVLYPVVETIHERHICQTVLAPAQVEEDVADEAALLAKRVLKVLDGAGVFAIELFLTKDGKLLLNEIAPRVHNSGHFTIDACHTSQFEQHIRAISGLPLGDTSLTVPAAAMANVLGERDGETNPTGLETALRTPHTHMHLYGKSPTKIDRKMGHITATADSVITARDLAETARKQISV